MPRTHFPPPRGDKTEKLLICKFPMMRYSIEIMNVELSGLPCHHPMLNIQTSGVHASHPFPPGECIESPTKVIHVGHSCIDSTLICL